MKNTNENKNQQPVRLLLTNSPNDLLEETPGYSLAHASLAAAAEEAGHIAEALHLRNGNWEQKLKQKLEEFKPNYFGISILTDCRINAHKICKIVKEFDSTIFIIAGAVHASLMYKQTLQDTNINAVVIGEGEETLLELLSKGKNLKDIPGLAIRNENDEAILNPPRQRTINLDKFPIPKHELYSDIINRDGIAYIITGRGCINNPGCTFCCGQAYWQNLLSQRSAKKVFEEIQYLFNINPNIQEIQFLDDELLCNHQRVYELFSMINSADLRFKWICSARASSLTENIIKFIKENGCYDVHIGVESFSQTILDAANKHIKVKQMQNAIQLCRKNGLKTSLMCITGLPGETAETVNESIRGAVEIGEAIETCILLVYPGTKVYELAKEKSLLDDDYWLGEGMIPLYTCEHSKLRLMWWAYKTAIITHWHAGKLGEYLNRKLHMQRMTHSLNKLIHRGK